MRPIATDRVVRSVGLSVSLSVCHDHEPCSPAEPIVMLLWMLTRVELRNHVLHGDPYP